MGLEALPQTVPFLSQLRSTQVFYLPNPTVEQFQNQFIDLFHDFDPEKQITISITDSLRGEASVKISFDPSRAMTTAPTMIGFRPQQQPVLQQPVTIIPLTFTRSDFQGQKSVLSATIGPQGQPQFEPGKSLGISSAIIAPLTYNAGENAAWLSQLSIQKRSSELLEAVQSHFSFIRGLTSESLVPGVPATVYADIEGLSRKIQISLVSGGISRLLTIILAIVSHPKGVVLIDEVENGLFHDQFAILWKTILDLATRYNSQIFVSTHSKECLVGAVQAINSDPASFALLRLSRADSCSSIEMFPGEQAEAALEKNGEVRDS